MWSLWYHNLEEGEEGCLEELPGEMKHTSRQDKAEWALAISWGPQREEEMVGASGFSANV